MKHKKPEMQMIEESTQAFAAAHDALSGTIDAMQEEIQAVQRRFMPKVRELVGKAAGRKADLHALIEANAGLFDKPRTVVFYGIKVGMQKGKGGIEIEDPDHTLVLIRKTYADDKAAALIHTKESPNKEALELLTVAELKKLGCTVKDTTDAVVIKSTTSEVDKIVAALLDGAEEAQQKAA